MLETLGVLVALDELDALDTLEELDDPLEALAVVEAALVASPEELETLI